MLSERELNRAVLARQSLLKRRKASLPKAVEGMAWMQAQYAPSMYVGLWSRLEGFDRDSLTRSLERRSVVQGTLLRATIHLVSARDYWPLTAAIRSSRREMYALAEDWIGPDDGDEADGAELIDLPRASLPDPQTPATVRFLPTWDATLLAHARRAQILRDQDRPRVFNVKTPQSAATFLVDGQVAGTWRHEKKDGIELTPFRRLDTRIRRELRDEADRLADFHT